MKDLTPASGLNRRALAGPPILLLLVLLERDIEEQSKAASRTSFLNPM
jgi:hypothetical protein